MYTCMHYIDISAVPDFLRYQNSQKMYLLLVNYSIFYIIFVSVNEKLMLQVDNVR